MTLLLFASLGCRRIAFNDPAKRNHMTDEQYKYCLKYEYKFNTGQNPSYGELESFLLKDEDNISSFITSYLEYRYDLSLKN